jgi:hypothetical protein
MKTGHLIVILVISLGIAIAAYFFKFKDNCKAYALKISFNPSVNTEETRIKWIESIDGIKKKSPSVLIGELATLASTQAELEPFAKVLRSLKIGYNITCANEEETMAFEAFKNGTMR